MRMYHHRKRCRCINGLPICAPARKIGLKMAALAVVLLVLSACAKQVVRPDSAPAGLSSEPGSAVAPLPEGRKGFIIREVPRMDEDARRDFAHAVELLQGKQYGPGAELLEKIVEQSPGVTAPYINLAIAYRHLDKPEEAEAQLKKALELVPGHPAACNEFGLLYRQSGRFDEARAMYEKVLARFPDYYPVHRNLGILCDLYLNDLECALEHYEMYSRAKPDDEQVQLWIADLRMRLGIR